MRSNNGFINGRGQDTCGRNPRKLWPLLFEHARAFKRFRIGWCGNGILDGQCGRRKFQSCRFRGCQFWGFECDLHPSCGLQWKHHSYLNLRPTSSALPCGHRADDHYLQSHCYRQRRGLPERGMHEWNFGIERFYWRCGFKCHLDFQCWWDFHTKCQRIKCPLGTSGQFHRSSHLNLDDR